MSQVVRATAAGIRSDDAETLIQAHGNDAMKAGLDSLLKRAASEFPEPLRDPYRYLRALLESSSVSAAKKAAEEGAAAPASKGVAAAAAAVEGWTSEWVSRRRAAVVKEFEALPAEEQAEWVRKLRAHLVERAVHPSIRKRLESHGWKHQLVAGELIRFFKGADWDKPSSHDLLTIAAEHGARAIK